MEERPPSGTGDSGETGDTGDTDDTEARWRQIVENYGERVEVLPDEYTEQQVVLGFTPATEEPEVDEYDFDEPLEDDEGFVPPPAPPLPRTTPGRLLAWLGALGSPVVVVVLLLADVGVPRLLGWGLIAAFVGGFGYLVATMPSDPRDPWDDGSRL